MKPLDYETKVRFNVDMHGVKKGEEVNYGRSKANLQRLIRRRLADNDNSVEVLQDKKKTKKGDK